MSSVNAARAPAYNPDTDSPLAQMRQLRGPIDKILAGIVILFAFVLASTPVRNSDLWLYLASGRHLASDFAFLGTDPFAHTADGWLHGSPTAVFDLASYAVHALAGPTGLALARSCAFAGLALVLLRACGSQRGLWVPCLFAALVLTAIAPRWQLQPIIVSWLCLPLTIGYLERRTAEDASSPGGRALTWASCWPLYLLFVIWANADPWFLLGPFALACYWLGGYCSSAVARGARVPAIAVVGGLLVCLLNPAVYVLWGVPPELAFRLQHSDLAHDSLFGPLFVSPLLPAYYQPLLAGNPASLAMAALVFAGILAVLLARGNRWVSRLLLCAGLAALGLFQARNLPFLALALAVLGPRACLEWSAGWFKGRPGIEQRTQQAVTGRIATVVLGLVLVALAWMGRVQGGLPEARAWYVESEPSLVQAARQLAAWRAAGKLTPDSRGFNFSPESASYFAWHCPDELGFLDARLLVPAPTALEYAAVRNALMGAGPYEGLDDWRGILRRHGIDHLVLADRDATQMRRVLKTVLAAPDEWRIWLQAGRVLVVGWRDPARNDLPGETVHDAQLNTRWLCPTAAERAPASPTPKSDTAARWWHALVAAPIKPSLDRDEAALCLLYYETQQVPTMRTTALAWQRAQAAAGVGLVAARDLFGAVRTLGWTAEIAAAAKAPNNVPVTSQFAVLQRAYSASRDDGPPACVWAAIRACRRALAINPDDAEAHLLLGRAYSHLVWNSPERTWGRSMPLLVQLRKVQAIAALKQAARLRPDLERAHQLLVALYQDTGYFDLGLGHTQDLLKAQVEHGRHPGESAEQFAHRLAKLREAVDAFRRDVAAQSERYEKDYLDLTLAARARLADRLGLGQMALDMLLASDVAAFGKEGMQTEFEMLLSTGRIDEARAWLDPMQRSFLGEFNHRWLSVRIAAAAGDYALADAQLRDMASDSMSLAAVSSGEIPLERAAAISFAASVSNGAAEALAPMPLARLVQAATGPGLEFQTALFRLREAAELALMRGMLAMEQGDLEQAKRHLARALALTPQHTADAAPETSVRPAVLYYLDLCAACNNGESRP